jgi:hypothetical protein
MLALLISRAKQDGQFNGLVPHLVDGGLSILQYADDTILFMEHNIEQATNLRLLLCIFEQLSGLNINFHKSELFCYGEAKEWETSILSSLDVVWGIILSNISVFQCIIKKSAMRTEK